MGRDGQCQPVWRIHAISKAFPGVQALDHVSLDLYPGEIHALVGQNGSGKTTLVKCISGAHLPDEGDIRMDGTPLTMANPTVARAHGVATIYQELSLVPTLSVAENIFLGRLPARRWKFWVDWEAMRRRSVRTLEELGIRIDPDAVVGSLSVGEQQLAEIAKAISEESTLLVMDEPTAALGLSETRRLHELIRRLADQGKSVLYISHRIDEVLDIADRVTVLKDGRVVESQPIQSLNGDLVVRLMLGTEVKEHYPKQPHATAVPCLEVEGLRTENGVNGVSFTINVGEVLGLGGVVGAGRTQIARALYGIDPPSAGTVRLNGRTVRFASPREAIEAGVALLPENRKADGLFFNFEGPQNITIARLSALLAGPFLNLRREVQLSSEYMDKLSISRAALVRTVQFLSGGNQQKVIIARWLFSQARLLILDEPTQGVDIGARIEVYRLINELTAAGISILLISSDYPELLAMCDRIAIVRGGRIVGIWNAHELNEYRLLEIASGVGSSEARRSNAN